MRAAVALAVAVSALAAVPASAARSHPLRLRVSPSVGEPHTVFRVGLDAPLRLYSVEPRESRNGRYQTLSVYAEGPAADGCQSSLSASAEHARRGQRLRLALAPDMVPLCPGRWRGTVSVGSGINCDPAFGPCPAQPAFVRRIGRFAFVVLSGS